MYGRSDVNVKVERGSTFPFTRGFSYIVYILFTHVKPVKSLRPYARKNYATVEIHLKSVFLDLHSRKTVRFSEQIMSADKYPSIFSRHIFAYV